MKKTTYFFALMLMALGVASFEMTDRASVTALIPAFLGVILFVCALLSRFEKIEKHIMHLGVLMTLIGFGGSVKGIPQAIKHFQGEAVARPAASVAQAIMAVICFVYLVLAIRFFINNRRRKRLEAQGK